MSNGVDPLTPLTGNEKKLIKKLSTRPREWILQELKDNLETATHIELATIPIYLYTYYSLLRNARSGENIKPADLFADKAGGVIMSVAVEEMLHMSLACNVLFSLGGTPKLYGHSPSRYPAGLPHHSPKGPPGPDGSRKVKIPLAKLGFEQLWHFLQIEYPEPTDALPEKRKWQTIGQFYSYVRCLICCPQVSDEDFQVGPTEYQIQPYNYSPNNVDTAHPKSKFDPWGIPPTQGAPAGGHPDKSPSAAEAAVFSNMPDSHTGPTQLVTVASRWQALQAIDTICDQGEGFGHEAFDDPADAEESHYYKFLTLQAQLDEYRQQYPHLKEHLPPTPTPPKPVRPSFTAEQLHKAGVLYDFPDNPTTAGYPAGAYRDWSNLCNGLYQYMLILTETIFKVRDEGPDGGGQKSFFNQGMHKSMIWILDKLIQKMREQDPIPKGRFKGRILAPTFENYPLGSREDGYKGAFEKLLQLVNANATTAKDYGEIVASLPQAHEYWD